MQFLAIETGKGYFWSGTDVREAETTCGRFQVPEHPVDRSFFRYHFGIFTQSGGFRLALACCALRLLPSYFSGPTYIYGKYNNDELVPEVLGLAGQYSSQTPF